MGKLVAAFGVAHAPGQTGSPESAEPGKRERVFKAWDELRKRLEAARPDVLVAVSNDHLQNFFQVQPAFCVGVAETHTLPRESAAKMMGLASHPVRGHPAFAEELIQTGTENGLDLAFSGELQFGDEFAVPKHFLDPEDKVPLVPILTNCLYRHQPPPKRFYKLGEIIAKTIEGRPREERVAVIGTGGLSHDPLGPNWGLIDERFDRRFLELLGEGDTQTLFEEYTLEKILEP